MDEAREILGVRQDWLGFVDSGLPEGDPLPPLPDGCFGLMDVDEAAEPLVRLIRSFRPHVMTTYDENGGYPHPDHIMCHKISVHAFDAAARPRRRYPEAGAPWQPLKLYYNQTFTKARTTALHEAMLARRPRVAVRRVAEALGGPRGARPSPRTCRAASSSRSATGRCSRTPPRSTPTAPGSRCPIDLQREVWPTEDFELARAVIDVADDRGRPVRGHPRDGAGPMTRDACCGVVLAADNTVSPGVLGFVVVALLGVATWLLVRSMRRQLQEDRLRRGRRRPTRPGDDACGSGREPERPRQ